MGRMFLERSRSRSGIQPLFFSVIQAAGCRFHFFKTNKNYEGRNFILEKKVFLVLAAFVMGHKKHRTWTHEGKNYASKEYPREGVGWTVFPNDMIELEDGRNLIAMDSSEEIVSTNEPIRAVADQEPPLEWMDQSWVRVRSSIDPIVSALLKAARRVQPVWIRYEGGSSGGSRRQILPAIVFRSEEEIYASWDHIYCVAWCGLRQAPRLFRIDRIAEVVSDPVLDRGSFPTYRALGEIEWELCECYHLAGENLKIIKFETGGKGEVLAIP